MIFTQNRRLAHICLPLLQYHPGQLIGKPGAHGPLSVLLDCGIGPLVSVEYGKFTSHLAAEGIQKLRLVLRPCIILQFIGQYIGSAYTYILHHGHGKPVKHQYTEHHHYDYAHSKHQRHQVPHLTADSFAFPYRFRMILVHLYTLRLIIIESPEPAAFLRPRFRKVFRASARISPGFCRSWL